MTRSMTAYSRFVTPPIEGVSWTVEIHSVNRKGFDLHIFSGKELFSLDLELRKMVGEEISRGQVTLKISPQRGGKGEISLTLLKQLKKEWEKTAEELKFPKEQITLEFLLGQSNRVLVEEGGEKVQNALKKGVKHTLDALIKMKSVEGLALEKEVLKHLKLLESNVKKIKGLSKKEPEAYRKKLVDRLKELSLEIGGEERVLREVALFAEKIDITEELARLDSHFNQFKGVFQSGEKSIGKTLEFLTQEMGREINTIGSKTQQLEVTKLVLSSKGMVEKIREQVQNIE